MFTHHSINMIIESIINLLKGKSSGAIIRSSILDDDSHISGGTRFYSSVIHSFSYIGRNGYFYKTEIGKYCSIADNCNCGMPEHRLDYVSTSQVFLKGKNAVGSRYGVFDHPEYKKTSIGNDVWIGSNVLIKAGVSIGDGSVLGMGSVVTTDIPAYAIVGGNPAKVIRYRFDDNVKKELLELQWWNLDDRVIQKIASSFESPTLLKNKLESMKL